MPQKDTWEREYNKPQLIKISHEPRADLKDYVRFLKKSEGILVENLRILDLGSGNGKNANYLAGLGNKVVGIEISTKAIEMAREQANKLGVAVDYIEGDIGGEYPFEDRAFDLVIDIMASNSLDEKGREVYLKEVSRVLKSGGYFFVRGLCKDGDKNAKNLLKLSPGKEYDTYINKGMGLVERVFSEQDFRDLYSQHFDIQELAKKTNYAEFNGQPYKRNYWLAYMKKI